MSSLIVVGIPPRPDAQDAQKKADQDAPPLPPLPPLHPLPPLPEDQRPHWPFRSARCPFAIEPVPDGELLAASLFGFAASMLTAAIVEREDLLREWPHGAQAADFARGQQEIRAGREPADFFASTPAGRYYDFKVLRVALRSLRPNARQIAAAWLKPAEYGAIAVQRLGRWMDPSSGLPPAAEAAHIAQVLAHSALPGSPERTANQLSLRGFEAIAELLERVGDQMAWHAAIDRWTGPIPCDEEICGSMEAGAEGLHLAGRTALRLAAQYASLLRTVDEVVAERRERDAQEDSAGRPAARPVRRRRRRGRGRGQSGAGDRGNRCD